MYIEFVATKSEKEHFEDFIKVELYENTNGEIQIDEFRVKLNPNSLKNIFVYKDYEINILRQDVDMYKITIYKPDLSSSDFKFGCELETCLNLDCINPMTENITNLYIKLKDTNDEKYWKELILIYIQKVIVKNASKEFKRLFPWMCVAVRPKNKHFDYIINTSNGIVYDKYDINFNRYITFTRDSSLVCGDSENRFPMNTYSPKKNTIHCEIITPTMDSINNLKVLYDSIVNPLCLNYNPSTSFHVNISFIKPIYFSFGLCDEIIQNYKGFEVMNYRIKEDEEESKYALRLFDTMIENIIYDMGSIMYYGNKKTYRYESQKFLDDGYYRAYINFNEKYSSLYCKSNRLIEFRLFSSDNEMSSLLEYLYQSISLLKDSYENYRNNFNMGFNELQKINLKTGIDFSPLGYYEGPLYSVNPNFPQYRKLSSITDNLIENALINLFNKRHQIFYDINRHKSLYIIRTFKNKQSYDYYISQKSEDIFIIELIKN